MQYTGVIDKDRNKVESITNAMKFLYDRWRRENDPEVQLPIQMAKDMMQSPVWMRQAASGVPWEITGAARDPQVLAGKRKVLEANTLPGAWAEDADKVARSQFIQSFLSKKPQTAAEKAFQHELMFGRTAIPGLIPEWDKYKTQLDLEGPQGVTALAHKKIADTGELRRQFEEGPQFEETKETNKVIRKAHSAQADLYTTQNKILRERGTLTGGGKAKTPEELAFLQAKTDQLAVKNVDDQITKTTQGSFLNADEEQQWAVNVNILSDIGAIISSKGVGEDGLRITPGAAGELLGRGLGRAKTLIGTARNDPRKMRDSVQRAASLIGATRKRALEITNYVEQYMLPKVKDPTVASQLRTILNPEEGGEDLAFMDRLQLLVTGLTEAGITQKNDPGVYDLLNQAYNFNKHADVAFYDLDNTILAATPQKDIHYWLHMDPNKEAWYRVGPIANPNARIKYGERTPERLKIETMGRKLQGSSRRAAPQQPVTVPGWLKQPWAGEEG